MKFTIPLVDGKLMPHFGHCQEFALIDVEDNQIKKKEILVPPPHEPGILAKWLYILGTKVVIAGEMEHMAIDLFNQAGITVVIGAPSEEPETLVKSYLNETLLSGDNLRADGGHHQCDN